MHRRWEFMVQQDETPAGIQQPAAIRALLSRWLAPHEYAIWRASAYRFHALVLQSWRQGNVFFLGDAAHMTPPFMAQGMCQGIRDAANLVRKLAMVQRGQASAALLDTYQQERQPQLAVEARLRARAGASGPLRLRRRRFGRRWRGPAQVAAAGAGRRHYPIGSYRECIEYGLKTVLRRAGMREGT